MTYATTRGDGLLEADFRIGKVVSESTSIFLRNVVAFSLIASLTVLPSIPFYFLDEQAEASPTEIVIVFACIGLIFILWQFVSAIVLYATFQHMRGRPVSIIEATRSVMPRAPSLLGLMLFGMLGTMVALVLLIIPGLYLMVIWFVSGAACVAEKLGARQSFRRSRELTKGFRWQIFALLLLIIFATGLGSILSALVQLAGLGEWGELAADFIWQGLSGGFSSVIVAVTYYYLRVAKDGVDAEQIAAVFD